MRNSSQKNLNKTSLIDFLKNYLDFILIASSIVIYLIVMISIKTSFCQNINYIDGVATCDKVKTSLFYYQYVRGFFFVPLVLLFFNLYISVLGICYKKYRLFLRILNIVVLTANVIITILASI